MADFDRDEEFRRNLRQLRELRAQGYAFEAVPIGGDKLSGLQGEGGVAKFQRELDTKRAEGALRALDRKIAEAKRAEISLRKAAAVAKVQPRTLTERLRNRGFGTDDRGSALLGIHKLGSGRLSLRGAIRTLGGAEVLTSFAGIHTASMATDAIVEAQEEYKRAKEQGRTEREARDLLYGKAIEGFISRAGDITGGKGLWKAILRGSGFTEQGADKAVERAIARFVNEGELAKRENAQANAVEASVTELDHKFDKLATTGPKTFKLRNAAQAELFVRDKRNALEQFRLNELQLKRFGESHGRNGRDASGN